MAGERAVEAVVIGAGPAGLTAALALSALGTEAAISALHDTPAHDAADRRTTALLPGSIELLKNLSVWGSCASAGAPLEGVRIIDDRGGLIRAPQVLFRAQELGLASLGVNIPNAALNAALRAAARGAAGLQWLPPSAVATVTPGENAVAITLAEGSIVQARLAVAADGRNSIARGAAGIATRSWSYPQIAIVTTFGHTRGHANITTEFHRRAGPLTTVPLPGDTSSLVWVETPSEARRLASLDDRAFLAELEARLQGLLGRLGDVTPRATYPLSGLRALRLAQNRVALVGESAHVFPPIGAQGLNLGLRDAACLAECLSEARARGQDIGGPATLDAYHDARSVDVLSRTLSVDLLNRSLLTDFLPVQMARGLGLHLIAGIGPLRRLLMHGGLGAPGALPRLMQPGAIGPGLDGARRAGQVGIH